MGHDDKHSRRQDETVEGIAACLDDDVALLRDLGNVPSEVMDNMERAAMQLLAARSAIAAPNIEAFKQSRFGWFKPDGTFEELDPNLSLVDHRRDKARWVGGEHDMQLLRAVFSSRSDGGTTP